MTAFYIFAVIFCALICPLAHYKTLLLYQLSSYRLSELNTALRRKKPSFYLYYLLSVAFSLILCEIIYIFVKNEPFYFTAFIVGAQTAAVFFASYKTSKVKLKTTARCKRFIAAFVFIAAAVSVPLVIFHPPLYAVAPFLSGVIALPAAHAVMTPIEKHRNAKFISAAKTKLAESDAVKIGITGSYGKTTSKNMLIGMLKSKYSVCATPSNYNTPLGIAKTVNEELLPDDSAFIAEMGARYVGDIKELCDIVRPDYAMITAIGNQHLETFGSEENILKTKNELVEALGEDGLAVFNGDNDGCVKLYERCLRRKLISGRDEDAVRGIKAANNVQADKSGGKRRKKSEEKPAALPHSKYDAYYGDIGYGQNGISFTMVLFGKTVKINTRLLGNHIPSLITQCALLASALGVDADSIKIAAESLKPVAHRLELLYNGDDVIIDDAYNASEAGAANALDVLSSFAPRVRVLVTPGLVELGSRQKAANYELGKSGAAKCDYSVFVGSNACDLAAGATDGGMDGERLFSVKNLTEAVEILKNIKGEKAVLFENDLPDNY